MPFQIPNFFDWLTFKFKGQGVLTSEIRSSVAAQVWIVFDYFKGVDGQLIDTFLLILHGDSLDSLLQL